jgi:hypothetical protein
MTSIRGKVVGSAASIPPGGRKSSDRAADAAAGLRDVRESTKNIAPSVSGVDRCAAMTEAPEDVSAPCAYSGPADIKQGDCLAKTMKISFITMPPEIFSADGLPQVGNLCAAGTSPRAADWIPIECAN